MSWYPLQIPMNKGLEQHSAESGFERSSGLSRGINLDFGTKDAVRGRPGWTRRSGFTKRILDSSGTVSYDSVATKALTGYSNFKAISVLDSFGSRPGLVSEGRIYVDDGNVWQDRGGFCSAKVQRLCSYMYPVDGSPLALDNTMENTPYNWAGCGYDIGPVYNGPVASSLFTSWGILNSLGQVAGRAKANTSSGAMCAASTARIGDISATLTGSNLTLDLLLHTADTDTVTKVTLSSALRNNDSGVALLDVGTMFCICADYDTSVFYVGFWVDPASAADTYRILRVDTTGTILTTASFTTGSTAYTTSQPALWLTNTDAATNRLVVVEHTASGVKTKILNATTLVDQAIDVTLTTRVCTSMSPSIVCGVAESGSVWVCFTAQHSVLPQDGDRLYVYKRSLSAATSTFYNSWGWYRQTATRPTGHVSRIQHQPIKVAGRVLLGLSTITGNEGTAPTNGNHMAATWTVHDITDLWQAGVATGATSGSLAEPVCIASGPLEGSALAMSPVSAVVEDSSSSYRFSSIDWSEIRSAPLLPRTNDTYISGLVGEGGVVGMNRVKLLAPQYSQFQQTTIIAGSVPRCLSGGDVFPINFVWGARPSIIEVDQSNSGNLVVGDSYSLAVVYSWTDEQGKVHRSSPSSPWTTVVPAGTNRQFDVMIQYPYFAERLSGSIDVELYMTEANPSSSAVAYYLVGVKSFTAVSPLGFPTTIISVADAPVRQEKVLYTSGGVLSSQPVRADGGVATVRNRCWVSDGQFVYASRLGDEAAANEGPSWHIDDTLRLRVGSPGKSVIGLAEMGNMLAIFTEDGVWITAGDGPDDLGVGQPFRDPERMCNVGAVAQRSIASTPVGVVFQAAHTLADGRPETGGLFALDAGFNIVQLSAPVRDEVGDAVAGDVLFNDSRDTLYWSRPTTGDLLMFDKRVQAWSKWTVEPTITDLEGTVFPNSDPFTSFAVAAGYLVGVADEPAKLIGTAGTDTLGVTAGYPMMLRLKQIAVAKDQAGFGRCRSVQLVQDKVEVSEPYNVTVDIYDGDEQIGHAVHTALTGMEPPTESFTDKQKATSIDVEITASRAAVTWTGMVLLVRGLVRTKQGPRNYQ